jgi:hypothetical protein
MSNLFGGQLLLWMESVCGMVRRAILNVGHHALNFYTGRQCCIFVCLGNSFVCLGFVCIYLLY